MASTQVDQRNQEYFGSLQRAFMESEADYISIDGRSNMFLRNCVDFGLEAGILRYDDVTSRANSDSQWMVEVYRLIESGRERLLSEEEWDM